MPFSIDAMSMLGLLSSGDSRGRRLDTNSLEAGDTTVRHMLDDSHSDEWHIPRRI